MNTVNKADKSRPLVAAYLFDRADTALRDEDAACLNQLNYAFALIQNGEASGSHWQSVAAYTAFVRRHPHILPVLSVGGWGADGFSQAAAEAAGRARLVQSILALMEAHGFRGVDIDWEYPGSSAAGIASSPSDRENFTLLLQALREGLDSLTARDGKPRLLATALGADPALIANLDCARIGRLVDQVNLMTYDIQTPGIASHHTPVYGSEAYPLSVDSAVRAFCSAGIPRAKVMIGAAFYGRIFTLPSTAAPAPFAPALDGETTVLRYAALQKRLANASIRLDEQAKARYAIEENAFISYDDPVSIGYKGEYVRQNGLMGMMCWEYGCDADGELLRAMQAGLNPQE